MKTKGLSARTAMMATGALVVFFTGFIHVWSIFLPYVTKLTGWTESQTSLAFYLANALFVLGKFYLIVIAMTCGLIPYFLLSPVSQMLQTDAGVASAVAVFSVMAGSILNACARLTLPSIADRVGRIPCILAVFAVAFISMILLVFGKGLLVTAAVVLGYTCFGGVMGNFPSLVSQVFGMEHFSENYGYVMIALVVGSLSSPVISSFLRGAGTGWRGVFAFGAMCSLIAFVCLLALKKSFGKGKEDIRNHGR